MMMESRALFREIHKNTWLKKLNIDSRKPAVLRVRSERFWVVFCVHDDSEAFLEGYVDPRQAPSHNPEWSLPLKTVKHISHALVPVEQEYEFVVTLNSDIARFNANTWECMQEWVDTLRSKLREMKLLSPKENLYSKLPEAKPPLLPTRDPTSPLPAPPPVPAAIVPGIERIHQTTALSASTPIQHTNTPIMTSASSSTATSNSLTTVTTTSTTNTAMSNTSTQNLMNLLSNPLQAVSNSLDSISLASSDATEVMSIEDAEDVIKRLSHLQKAQKPNQPSTSAVMTFEPNSSNKKSDKVSVDVKNDDSNLDTTATCSSNESSPSVVFQTEPIIIPRPHTSRSSSSADKNDPKKLRKKSPNHVNDSIVAPNVNNNNDTTANITIIQVSNSNDETTISGPTSITTTSTPSLKSGDHFTFNCLNNNNEDYKSNVQIIPSNIEYDHEEEHQPQSIIASINENSITTVKVPNVPQTVNNVQIITPVVVTATSTSTNSSTTSINISINNGEEEKSLTPPMHQYYEQVFMSPTIQIISDTAPSQQPHQATATPAKSKVILLSKQPRSSSHSEIQTKNSRNNNKENSTNQPSTSTSTSTQTNASLINGQAKRMEKNLNIYTAQPQRPLLQRGLTEMVLSSNRAAVNEPRNSNHVRGRRLNNHVTDKMRNEVNEHRKRSSSASEVQPETSVNVNRTRTRLQSPPQPFRPHHPLTETSSNPTTSNANTRLTLREQQVLQLRREMMHPGGVRLQLRKKDCVNSIGLVDAFGNVWVAGWKQKDHPVLYTALHIGDQIVTISGIQVTTAAEAQKTFRAAPGLFIELIIRRVPFGRVYAIRREMDGQCLGLIRDGNLSTIVDVVPNSLAARHGLPPKTQSCDGQSLTFWALTEINGRPLNLFFKDSEIKDRLNAVGRDISILVQPLDLVTKLKKQLKSLRSYKDFIVQ